MCFDIEGCSEIVVNFGMEVKDAPVAEWKVKVMGTSVDIASVVIIKVDCFNALEVFMTEDGFDTTVVLDGAAVGMVSEEEGDHIAAG